jgi:hypothetical protein
MPYILTGFDSAGERHEYAMDDTGAVTAQVPGDELLVGWLATDPYVKPDPIEGETAPESGDLTPSQLEAMRQHVSKLLTVVQMAPAPEAEVRGTEQEHARGVAPGLTDPPTAGQPEGRESREGRESSRAAASPPRERHTHAELEAMTVTDLRSLAQGEQIVGASSMSKAELLTALSAPHRG